MTVLPECPICDEPIHDGAWICQKCGVKLGDALTRIATLRPELDRAITRQAKVRSSGTHRERVAPGDEEPIPNETPLIVNLDAMETGFVVDNTVTTWARDLMETLDLDLPEAPQPFGPICSSQWCRHASCDEIRYGVTWHPTVAAAHLLRENVRWWRQRQEAPTLYEEITGAAFLLEAAVDSRRRDYVVLGPCPLTVDDTEGQVVACTGEVRAFPAPADLTTEEKRRERLPRCTQCKTDATVEWWQAHILGNPESSPLVTARDLIGIIAYRLEWTVTHDQIRQWKHRGKIESAGKDAKGRTLYRHAAVVQAIREDVRQRKERVGA